jgi:pyridoxal biosynthesis lyase PdxS
LGWAPGRLGRAADGADAARLAAAGYDLALVGSALMTSTDPAALLADMLRAGRQARC